MDAWVLTLRLWLGGPEVAEGPYTGDQCEAIGEAWVERSQGFVTRNPRLYPPGRSPQWWCFPIYPSIPFAPTFPTLQQRTSHGPA